MFVVRLHELSVKLVLGHVEQFEQMRTLVFVGCTDSYDRPSVHVDVLVQERSLVVVGAVDSYCVAVQIV